MAKSAKKQDKSNIWLGVAGGLCGVVFIGAIIQIVLNYNAVSAVMGNYENDSGRDVMLAMNWWSVLESLQPFIVPVAIGALIYVVRESRDKQAVAEQRTVDILEKINDQLQTTERERTINQRHDLCHQLRQTIEEDIEAKNYGMALALVSSLYEVSADRDENERLRQQIEVLCSDTSQAAIADSEAVVEELCEAHDWDGAIAECERLVRVYPDSPQAEGLMQKAKLARSQYKDTLERSFLERAQHGDAEEAMDILKELDAYLTPTEAEPYIEIARGVIGQKKENLGVQFKIAIQDRNWVTALEVGGQIIHEFPNSKFSDEVRGMIDVLRERAKTQRSAMGH